MDIKAYIIAAIAGAIVVPVSGSLYDALTGVSIPALSASYTTKAIITGAITGVIIVLVLNLIKTQM